jgi:hypothetical protein
MGAEMQLLSIQDFAGAANQEFALDMGESTMALTLIEVKPLPVQRGLMRAPFSLLFKCASPVILPQKTYRLKSAATGALSMFLVPVARDGAAIVYQAVYS